MRVCVASRAESVEEYPIFIPDRPRTVTFHDSEWSGVIFTIYRSAA
jgi:hypothetical protein